MAKRRIQMLTSLVGESISYAPEEVLVVQDDAEPGETSIAKDLAVAFCLYPEDAPRARPLDGWDPASDSFAGDPEPAPPQVERTEEPPGGDGTGEPGPDNEKEDGLEPETREAPDGETAEATPGGDERTAETAEAAPETRGGRRKKKDSPEGE